MKPAAYLIAALASQAIALPASEKQGPVADHGRASDVRRAFQTAWDGYYKYAFPHDDLLPLTNSYEDDRYGSAGSGIPM